MCCCHVQSAEMWGKTLLPRPYLGAGKFGAPRQVFGVPQLRCKCCKSSFRIFFWQKIISINLNQSRIFEHFDSLAFSFHLFVSAFLTLLDEFCSDLHLLHLYKRLFSAGSEVNQGNRFEDNRAVASGRKTEARTCGGQ